MHCQACMAGSDPDARFCSECGAALLPAADSPVEASSARPVIEIQSDIRSLVVRRMVPAYLKIAPEEALIRYMRSQVAELKHLAKVNPRHCVDFAFPEFATSELYLSRLIPKELQREDLEALAEVVKGVATNPLAPGGGAAARRHREAVVARAGRQHPGLAEVLSNPAGQRQRPAPERSGAILRYIFSV